jgi:hypothetical protein
LVIRPCAANRSEHIASQNPRANPVEPTFRKIVIDAGSTVAVAVHFLKSARGEEPLVQVHATNAERIVDVLIRAGPESVE